MNKSNEILPAIMMPKKELGSSISFAQKRKELALEMAQLLYDIFNEKRQTDIIESGQNNEQQNSEE